MVRGKAGMVARMPVLRQDDRIEIRHHVVDRTHDLIPAGDGQRAAGAEIHLHVDDNQRAHSAPLMAATSAEA